MKPEHRTFLVELGCDKAKHSGKTLLDHLKGVHDLLRDWGNSEDVCNAGLFHSIYGTDAYKHVSTTDRGKVIEQIGLYAEALVLMFSEGKRPFFKNVNDQKFRRDLMEIEAANLIEQSAGRNTLQRLLDAKLSDGAKAAIAMELSR